MDVFSIISVLGGLALFLYGMHVMGEGLKRSSGTALKNALEKVTTSPLTGFLLGLVVTAIIQSSTATIVLTVGLIGAGVLSLRQAISIVLGANVGTTATAQIIRLLDIDASGNSLLRFFKPDTLAPFAAIIGIIFIMFVKKRSLKSVGDISIGFGILFTGLLSMTAALAPLGESAAFYSLLEDFSKVPVLGFLAGAVLTIIIQSSSASIGILQVLCSTGALTFQNVYSVIIGINIGTCVTTALVCSIGSKADAKRTGIVHIAFNLIGAVIFMSLMGLVHSLGYLENIWSDVMSSGDIANFQTLFNLVTAVALLPFTRKLEQLSYYLIKDKPAEDDAAAQDLAQLDPHLFLSAPVALTRASTIIGRMGDLAERNVDIVFSQFFSYSDDIFDTITRNEEHIDRLADGVDHYLVELSGSVDGKADSDQLNFCIQTFSEFERIGDYAVNMLENATVLRDKQMAFSPAAQEELEVLSDAVKEVVSLATLSFKSKDLAAARRIEPLEEVIDDLVANLKDRHIQRLRNGQCTIYTGVVFLDMLSNAERIGDHCSNIMVYTLGQVEEGIIKSRHDYIDNLHSGKDSFFTEEYERNKERFLKPLGIEA